LVARVEIEPDLQLTVTGMPLSTPLPDGSSINVGGDSTLVLAPGELLVTDIRVPGLPCPQPCGIDTTPGLIASVTSTGTLMFDSSPQLAVYRDRMLLIALCQGGALHYINGNWGVKDLDVYTFYAKHPTVKMHPRRHTVEDFGESEFGCRPADLEERKRRFVGWAVDLLVRSLPVEPDADPIAAVRHWLQTSKNKSPPLLKEAAVVGLYPERYRGQVIWR
jgi:hypothetical protein